MSVFSRFARRDGGCGVDGKAWVVLVLAAVGERRGFG